MTILNNKTNLQFETYVDTHKALLQYRLRENTIFYMHTEVPEAIAGKGIAFKLAETALKYAKEKNFKIVVYCPFVVEYVKNHPEYLALLNTKFQKADRFKATQP